MKIYTKIIEGQQIIKPCNKIVIYKDDRLIISPTHEMLIEDGWEEYIISIPPEPTEKELFEKTKSEKLQELKDYDSSKEINICYIKTPLDTISYWANKTERSSLKSAIQDCIAMGRDTYRLDLREVGASIDIDCDKLLAMLSALEVYAIDCYNKTTDHIYAINTLTTVEEIEAYDYKVGYPEKLTFRV